MLAILLLVFVLANPRPLVTAYLALAPDRYREQAHRILGRMMRQMIAWARGVAINGLITGVSIGSLLWLIRVQPALMFGVFAFLGEFLPNIGAFLVSIPILLVALSMGATKFWLALRRDRAGLSGRTERPRARCARQRNAIASGQHFVFYPGDRRIVWAIGSASRRPCRRAGANRNRRILLQPRKIDVAALDREAAALVEGKKDRR